MSGTPHTRSVSLRSLPWLVVVVGVVVMVLLLVVALGSAGRRRPVADLPPPAPTMSMPNLSAATPSLPLATGTAPAVPGLLPRSAVPPSPSASSPSATPAGAGTQPSTPNPPRASPSPALTVTGRFRVMADYGDSFAGEVLLTNTTSGPRSWTIRLVQPRGRLGSVWVESAPQGTARMRDGVLTYTSGVELTARGSVQVRFIFEGTGGTMPSGCTVNGSACAGL
ncbi:cellulose-binding protein [Micromonospora sp. KC723]|uniref:cellulose-binding protein n=1 Tax=Micromonospora sp. KC723 TaxID=2530381 RepID=UPI0010518891|nr:cellulose-binding protein [Micromonospora sp. KC723]TDB69785.1 cellulose-binding protein [Micromonospora sp. KC723]